MAQDERKQNFSHIIEKNIQSHSFMRFDVFIIQHMGYAWEETDGQADKIRKDAYHSFLKRITGERPASLPTIRRWFGIRQFTAPSREQVFRIAFSLKLDIKKTENYLLHGICEPSFQINDYSEILAMYGLEHHWSYKKYEDMVSEYEANLDAQQEISKKSNTNWLFHQFESVKHYSEEEFMCWMWENAKIFKGYSKTTQEYLHKYREQVVEYMRLDVKKSLKLLLSETGYETWRKKHISIPGTNEGKLIKKYIKSDKRTKKRLVSEHLEKNILELTNLAYSEKGLNTKLISELFTVPQKQTLLPTTGLPEHTAKVMSGKYLSDLFHIPEKNEMRIHIRQAIHELAEKNPEGPCPEHILDMIQKYSKKDVFIENAGEALEWLQEADKEGKRRCLIVKREDLLPMILYVAQQKYQEQIKEEGAFYHQADARKSFTELANATLIACNMAPLDENYLFDMLLLSCFQEHELYGYEDVLELV